MLFVSFPWPGRLPSFLGQEDLPPSLGQEDSLLPLARKIASFHWPGRATAEKLELKDYGIEYENPAAELL